MLNTNQPIYSRGDESPDELFYMLPRMVTHIDDYALAAVTQLYREYLPTGGDILDLMSSWVSHLPQERGYGRLVGLGLNQQELARNPRLSAYVVHNLNRRPRLPFEDREFDAATICVSIDYLTQPVAVLREVGRVLRPNAPLIITFSNRCFPTKVIDIWLRLTDKERLALVAQFVEDAGCFSAIQQLDRSPSYGSDPLYAVVARRSL